MNQPFETEKGASNERVEVDSDLMGLAVVGGGEHNDEGNGERSIRGGYTLFGWRMRDEEESSSN